VPDDHAWSALVDRLDRPAWAVDPKLALVDERRRRHDEIDAELGAWCSSRPAAVIVEQLWPAGVPAAEVLMPHEQSMVEQLQARAFFEEVTHPLTGTNVHATYPVRFSSIVGPLHLRHSPMLGEHNNDILHDLLGYPLDEIAALEHNGVLGTRPRAPRR